MEPEAPLRRLHLLAMNASSVGLLAVGFINAMLVPKMAIDALGIEEYGRFAFLLGFCFVPTILDFGLMPGLTREVGRRYADDLSLQADALVLRFQRLLGILGALVVVGLAVGVARSTRGGGATLAAVLAGAGANVVVMVTDVGMIRTRVQGRIVAANATRATYYVTYLFAIGLAYLLGRMSVPWMFYGQAAGAVVYALVGWLQYHSGRSHRAGPVIATGTPWKALWRAALPEQVTRVQSAFLPGMERTLILAAGGASQLGAYDVALRLSVLVTALPAAIAEPVLALLSTRMQSTGIRERELILRYATRVTSVLTAVALVCALLLCLNWAESYYRLGGTSFKLFAVFVMLGSGFNVLTATPAAGLYSVARFGPILAKTCGDLVIAGVALAALAVTAIPEAYVGARYLGYFVTAGGLLFFWRRFRRNSLAGVAATAPALGQPNQESPHIPSKSATGASGGTADGSEVTASTGMIS